MSNSECVCFSMCAELQKAFLYGEILLNELWRKYASGNSATRDDLSEMLVELFVKLQRLISSMNWSHFINCSLLEAEATEAYLLVAFSKPLTSVNGCICT